jgi:hypothetical protein
MMLSPPLASCSNRIQVSSSKKPMFFYVNLSKVNSRLLGVIRILLDSASLQVQLTVIATQ